MAKVILDKERELYLDLNAIEKFYDQTGINLLEGEKLKEAFTNASPKVVKTFLWCCLLRDSPDLTLEEVGKLVTIQNLGAVTDAILSLVSEAENPLP